LNAVIRTSETRNTVTSIIGGTKDGASVKRAMLVKKAMLPPSIRNPDFERFGGLYPRNTKPAYLEMQL